MPQFRFVHLGDGRFIYDAIRYNFEISVRSLDVGYTRNRVVTVTLTVLIKTAPLSHSSI